LIVFLFVFSPFFCQAAPKSLSQLFNDYAKPREMWDVCLEVVGFSTHSVDSADVVLRLWDWYLLQGASSSAASGPNAVLEEACARVERLGVKFYTNEAAFPMEHVTLRLHLIAAGLWPERDYAAHVALNALPRRWCSPRAGRLIRYLITPPVERAGACLSVSPIYMGGYFIRLLYYPEY
jgi:hypothetical protein